MAGKSQRERWEGLRKALERELVERDWTQDEMAAAAGVKRETVNRVMSREEITPGVALAIASALGIGLDELRRRVEQAAGGATQRGAPVIRKTPMSGAHAVAKPPFSAEARAFILEFQAQAVREGATDEDLEFIKRSLTAPELYVLHAGGHARALTDEETMIQLRALAEGLRVWLRGIRELRRHAGGEPTA